MHNNTRQEKPSLAQRTNLQECLTISAVLAGLSSCTVGIAHERIATALTAWSAQVRIVIDIDFIINSYCTERTRVINAHGFSAETSPAHPAVVYINILYKKWYVKYNIIWSETRCNGTRDLSFLGFYLTLNKFHLSSFCSYRSPRAIRRLCLRNRIIIV